ncbi:hypothetical protein DB345_02005 [Spartobacteria bacterium LR76]|nr:hypothetical protein DB345_02005 [Spartobacteria bacterium LR76]
MDALNRKIGLEPSASERDEDLPFGHLQLGRRPHNTCLNLDLKTIADVIRGLEARTISASSAGAKTCQEIEQAIERIRSFQSEEGVDWDQFWIEQGLAKDRVFMTSRSLERLLPEVRSCSLGMIHLGKACTGLEAAGIDSVGKLIDAARSGFDNLKNFGAKAHSETMDALKALSSVAQADGSVDWIEYAARRGFEIIPQQSSDTETFVNDILPAACERVIRAQFEDRDWNIFKRRLLVSKEESETLQAIGDVYGITRERVRQIESLCLDALRSPLIENDYRKLAFRFQPEFVEAFRSALAHYTDLGVPAWIKSRWIRELAQLWQASETKLMDHYRLVAEILGFKSIPSSCSILEPLVVDQKTPNSESNRWITLIESIHEILSDGAARDSFELAKVLKAKRLPLKNVDEIPFLIELCSTVESVKEDLYRLRFEYLRGRANQAVRVLNEAGAPLHNTALIREINRQLPRDRRLKNVENLVGQMSSDNRLLPIGKSGKWSLAEWKLETRPIIELIEEIFTDEGEAIHIDDLTERVLKLRTGSAASISLILSCNPDRFRRVAPHIYGLTAWGKIDESSLLDLDTTAQFVERYFEQRAGKEVPFKELREAFSKETGSESRSAAGILANNPAVKIVRPKTYIRLASFNPNWRSEPTKRTYTRRKPPQVDVIVAAVTKKLEQEPTGERPLVDIVSELEKELDIRRATIYPAIDQSEAVEKITIKGSAFKICRLTGRSHNRFPELPKLKNPAWRAECERAVEKLTPKDVDIALFLLGRQFDQAMRLLLEAARDQGGFPVSEGHINRLQNRIDWAVSQHVFTDKANLVLLKNERNERGHEPPAPDEQEATMKYAPYLANLYIDYLIMIDDRIRGFKHS